MPSFFLSLTLARDWRALALTRKEFVILGDRVMASLALLLSVFLLCPSVVRGSFVVKFFYEETVL